VCEPLVSIVIPTYNSEKTLPLCLESINKQRYKNIEVIIVDNFSKDKAIEIARKYGAKVYSKGSEKSTQMNYGALKAKGEFVYFIDLDSILHLKVIKNVFSWKTRL